VARTLAEGEARVVLIDLVGDGAVANAVGEGAGQPGLSDVFDRSAAFGDVLFRDQRSRLHFVPAGTRNLAPTELTDDRLETILAALSLTYDQVVLDARDDLTDQLAPAVARVLVVSEYDADDARTARAMARIRAVAEADVRLLVIGPGKPTGPSSAAVA
jgi:MinD-like ATPase involved in chromosome partitioning or flagellar assembly